MTIVTKKTVSTNALTSEQIRIINLLYPVGSYYETSDTSFNPNTDWVGTWTYTTSSGIRKWHRTAA